MKLSEALITELNTLATSSALNMTDPRVTGSLFYKALQTETELTVKNVKLSPEAMLLVARIAAISPLLNTVDMSDNDLGEHGPATAAALAISKTILTVDMSDNDLGEHGPKTANDLAKSLRIRTVNMSTNSFGEQGSETATSL
ncbi:MAG: hypothetical protein K2P31_04310, partial [Rickettsiaceae bacterium]|nr:hypothetical protein [Rickettsiaceae bacterium]